MSSPRSFNALHVSGFKAHLTELDGHPICHVGLLGGGRTVRTMCNGANSPALQCRLLNRGTPEARTSRPTPGSTGHGPAAIRGLRTRHRGRVLPAVAKPRPGKPAH